MTSGLVLEIVLSLCLQVCFVVLATAAVARRRRSARSEDHLWSCCILALLLLPAFGFLFPHLRLAPIVGESLGSTARQLRATAMVLGLVWIVGAIFLFGRLARDLLQLVIFVQRSRQAPDWLMASVSLIHSGDSAGKAVQAESPMILVSDQVRSPACWQLQRPHMVLPAAVLEFPPAETVLVLRHEQAHLSYGHPLMLFLQRLLVCGLWFHPAVWYVCRRAESSREFACDEAALGTREEAALYLRAMLRIVELGRDQNAPSSALLGFGRRSSLMVERAGRISRRDWSLAVRSRDRLSAATPICAAVIACAVLWLPLDPTASRRSNWSPWPAWSSSWLRSAGVAARDYERDGFRLQEQERRRALEVGR